MIKKYCFGNVFKTESVVKNINVSTDKVPYFNIETKDDEIVLNYNLDSNDAIYGLGEVIRGINKRGWIYKSLCEDAFPVHESRTGSYAAHNFLIVSGVKTFGVYFDTPTAITYDIAFTDIDLMTIKACKDFDLYIVEGKDELDIVKQFREIIGQSYIPPFFAFGFAQSRWGYKCKEDLLRIANDYEKCNMPLDMINIDIDCMDDYKDFTFNDTFDDAKAIFEGLKERGIRVVPIVDAAIKKDDTYDVYNDCLANKACCVDKDGNPYVVGVWPGDSLLPDYLSANGREWFGAQYKRLLDLGIEAFWNDMNEPSLFYSRHRINEAFTLAGESANKNLSLQEFWNVTGAISALPNNIEDYKEFYHNVDGKLVCHYDVHNLYGYNMVRSASEYFKKYNPKKRYLIYSRSSFIGSHRYGGIWTGDNASWWSQLLLEVSQLPGLNMCGFIYSGADLGGFGESSTEDLMIRWLQFGIFVPLFRNHSSFYTRLQEFCYLKRKEIYANLLTVRYALVPYLYNAYINAVYNNSMLFTPLSFIYKNDSRVTDIQDQLMFGNDIMLAPIYTQNTKGRYVYLPERMLEVRMTSSSKYETRVLEKGDHFIEVPFDEIVFFVKEGSVIPVSHAKKNIADINYNDLYAIRFNNNDNEVELYQEIDDEIVLKKVSLK